MTPSSLPLRLPSAKYAVAGSVCLLLGGWILFQSHGGPSVWAALAGADVIAMKIAQVFTLVPTVLGVWPVMFAFGAFLAGFGVLVLVGAANRDRVLRLGDEFLEWEALFGRRLRVPLRDIVAVEANAARDHLVILCPPNRRVIPADWFTPESGGLAGAIKTVAAHVEARRPKKRAR